MKRTFLALIAICLLTLTGCGGSGGSGGSGGDSATSGMPDGVKTALDNYQKAMLDHDSSELTNVVSIPFTIESQVTSETHFCENASVIFNILFAGRLCSNFEFQSMSYVATSQCSGTVTAVIHIVYGLCFNFTNTVQMSVTQDNLGVWRIGCYKTIRCIKNNT
jgi:hypothetical protein